MSHKIYLDSNIFIAFFDGSEISSPLSKQLLYDIGTSVYAGFCSVLLFVELLEDQKKSQNQNQLLEGLPGLTFINIDKNIALTSQSLRADNSSLKSPDALHLATAIGQNCDYFISQDKKLNKIACKYLNAVTIDKFYKVI